MADLSLPPLLAHAPEKSPPTKWWTYLLPAILAVVGILIATGAAIEGQKRARERDIQALKLEYHTLNPVKRELSPITPRYEAVKRIEEGRPLDADLQQKHLRSYVRDGRHFTNWDGYRYEEIIELGYIYARGEDPFVFDPVVGERRIRNVVWYPLYPLLGYAVKTITGLPAVTALTAVSNICIVLAAMVFFAVARKHFFNRIPEVRSENESHITQRWDISPVDTAALFTVALLLFNPASVFFYANFTESIFMLLLATFLLCLQNRWWWRAALIAAVASSCRSQGVLFGPILALVFLLRSDMRNLYGRFALAFVFGLIAATGLIAYMIYLHLTFNHATAFMSAQSGWNVGINGITLRTALNPINALTHWMNYAFYTNPMDWPRLYEATCVVLPPIVLLILGQRFLSFEFEIFGWVLWGLPYVSNAAAGNPPGDTAWMSMGRFTAVNVGLLIIAGAVLVRFRWLAPFLLTVSAALFALFCYKFGMGDWIG